MFASRFKLIGARIKFYRTIKNLTQLDLAQQAGLSEDYVSQVERGKALGLTMATALLIANTLGVELEKLTKEEE